MNNKLREKIAKYKGKVRMLRDNRVNMKIITKNDNEYAQSEDNAEISRVI